LLRSPIVDWDQFIPRKAASCLAALLIGLLCGRPALAQRAVLVFENDAVFSRDRDYTNGFRGSVVFDDFARDRLAAQAFDFVRPGLLTFGAPAAATRQQFEWIIGQSIFTPDRVSSPVHTIGERPFGGWLYTGFNAAQQSGRSQLDSFEVLVGAVGGSASLAYEVQNGFHHLLGSAPVTKGYGLHNEPGVLVAWDRRWKWGVEGAQGYGADVIPYVNLTAGNVFAYAAAGGMVRIGQSLGTSWGPTRVRPGPSGASFIRTDPDAPYLGFALFAGAEGRAVARNVFLDGNTFEDSISVDRKPLVLDLYVGAEMFTQGGFRLAATLTERSREYTTQAKASLFGSLEGSFRF
jgi:hypothetical protein